MNLKRLEVFLAVADTGSFSRAAEVTRITQSTVSQHIIVLEEELGLRLLDRTGKGVLPTEAGKIVLARARRLLADAADLEVALKRFRGIEAAHLSIGASNIPGTYLIPDLLRPFADRYPGVTVTVSHADSRGVVELLQGEEVELGVVGSRFDSDTCTFTPFGEDTIALVAPSDHPLAGQAIPVDRLSEVTFVGREKGSGTEKTVLEILSRYGVDTRQLRVRARFGNNEAVKRGVMQGLGVAFVSAASVVGELRRGELAAISVERLDIVRQFFLVTRSNRTLSPPALAFRNLLAPGAGPDS